MEFWMDEVATIRHGNYINVINELKNYFNDYRFGVANVLKYHKVKHQIQDIGTGVKHYWVYDDVNKKGRYHTQVFKCCWGKINVNKINNNYVYTKQLDDVKKYYIKTGIEVMITGTHKSMLGFECNVKNLKQRCKDNGLKKYSKFNKLQLISLLMTI